MPQRNPYDDTYPPIPEFSPRPTALPTQEQEGEYTRLYRSIQAEEAAKEQARIAALPPRPEELVTGVEALNAERAQSSELFQPLTYQDVGQTAGDDLAAINATRQEAGVPTFTPSEFAQLRELGKQEAAYQAYAQTPEYRRSSGNLNDFAKAMYGGALGAAKGTAWGLEQLGMDTRETQARLERGIQRNVQEMTPGTQYAKGKEWLPGGEGPSAFLDPLAWLALLGEAIPGTVATLPVGGLLAKGAIAGVGAARGAALTGSTKATTGALGFAAAEGGQAGLMSGSAMADTIGTMGKEEFKKTFPNSEVYKELRAQGLTFTQARDAIRDDAAQQAAWTAGLANAAFGAIPSIYLTKLFGIGGRESLKAAGKAITDPAKTRLGQVGKGAAFEAGQEVGQSVGEQAAENLATRGYLDPEQSLTEGLGEAAAQGLAGGAAMGAAIGGLAHTPPVQTKAEAEAAEKAAEKAALEALGDEEIANRLTVIDKTIIDLEDQDVSGEVINTPTTLAYKEQRIVKLKEAKKKLTGESKRRTAAKERYTREAGVGAQSDEAALADASDAELQQLSDSVRAEIEQTTEVLQGGLPGEPIPMLPGQEQHLEELQAMDAMLQAEIGRRQPTEQDRTESSLKAASRPWQRSNAQIGFGELVVPEDGETTRGVPALAADQTIAQRTWLEPAVTEGEVLPRQKAIRQEYPLLEGRIIDAVDNAMAGQSNKQDIFTSITDTYSDQGQQEEAATQAADYARRMIDGPIAQQQKQATLSAPVVSSTQEEPPNAETILSDQKNVSQGRG